MGWDESNAKRRMVSIFCSAKNERGEEIKIKQKMCVYILFFFFGLDGVQFSFPLR